MSRRRSPVLLGLFILAACADAPFEAPAVDATPAAPVGGAQALSTTARAEATHEPLPQLPTPTPVAPAASDAAPTPAPTPSVAPRDPSTPGTPKTLTYPDPIVADAVPRLSDVWGEVERFDEAIELVRLQGGLLAHIEGKAHEYVDGRWEARPEIDAERPRVLRHAGPIQGQWDRNAWRVSVVEHDGEREAFEVMRFHRWRGNHKWVAQVVPDLSGNAGPSEYEYFDMGNSVARVSERGGLLLAAMSWERDGEVEMVRIAGGNTPAPRAQPLPEDAELVDVLETRGGTVYVVSEHWRQDRMFVQHSCRAEAEESCLMAHTVVLPKTGERRWAPTEIVARRRHSATLALREGLDDARTDYLLHYETGGYRFEAIPGGGRVEQLLAADDGGVWVVAAAGDGHDAVWHRSDEGQWHAIARPEALAEGALRLARHDGHVWISGDGTAVTLYRAPQDPTAPTATTVVMGAP